MKLNISSLCSLALGLWGVQTGFWVIAIPLILLLEGRHLVQRRGTLSLVQLTKLCKLSGAIVGLALIILLATQRSYTLIYQLIQWLPLYALPLIVAQIYATNTSALMGQLIAPLAPQPQKKTVNLCYPYFAICLLSASAANQNSHLFYGMFALLMVILLWTLRPQRANLILWACLLLLTSGLGWVGHLQLSQLQDKVEQQTAPWLSGVDVDPYQAVTQMGSIGSLKQSNAIVFRIATPEGRSPQFPLLIQDAVYNKYGSGAWVAMKSKFAPVPQSQKTATWHLGALSSESKSNSESNVIVVSDHLHGKQGILKLPNGVSQITQLPVDRMTRNQYGTVKVEGPSGAMEYQVQFDSMRSLDGPPNEADLEVPEPEQKAIAQAVKALNITDQSQSDSVDQVSAFFGRGFNYSLELSQPDSSSTPLSEFLLKTKTGHCEYFASATTLMLREMGIPARYAVGYSVHEFSPMEQQYIVRSRNAHAWSLAYVNGTWQAVDTTPPDWTVQENDMASPWQGLSDLWSLVIFQCVKRWDALMAHGIWGYVGGVLLLILLFQVWKMRHQLKFRFSKSTPQRSITEPLFPDQVGLDSEFYAIEKQLGDVVLARQSSESLRQWLIRLQPQLPKPQYLLLTEIVELHYRYRFDPKAFKSSEREQLSSLSQDFLAVLTHRGL